MSDCVFCKIIKREIPAEIVYEDEEVIAFLDIHPVTPVHILVIPKKHIPSSNDIELEDEKVIGKLFSTIKQIAKEKGIAEKGYRIIMNCGKEGGQVVDHIHFHLLGGRQLGPKVV